MFHWREESSFKDSSTLIVYVDLNYLYSYNSIVLHQNPYNLVFFFLNIIWPAHPLCLVRIISIQKKQVEHTIEAGEITGSLDSYTCGQSL